MPNIIGNSADIAERRRQYCEANRLKKERHLQANLDRPCLYQLYRGDTPMGKPQTLLVRDAITKNRAYGDAFWKALDTNPHARMYELRAVSAVKRKQRVKEWEAKVFKK